MLLLLSLYLLRATVEDTGKATIKSGTGSVNLKVGDNTFNVVVKAQDGTEETYDSLVISIV